MVFDMSMQIKNNISATPWSMMDEAVSDAASQLSGCVETPFISNLPK